MFSILSGQLNKVKLHPLNDVRTQKVEQKWGQLGSNGVDNVFRESRATLITRYSLHVLTGHATFKTFVMRLLMLGGPTDITPLEFKPVN